MNFINGWCVWLSTIDCWGSETHTTNSDSQEYWIPSNTQHVDGFVVYWKYIWLNGRCGNINLLSIVSANVNRLATDDIQQRQHGRHTHWTSLFLFSVSQKTALIAALPTILHNGVENIASTIQVRRLWESRIRAWWFREFQRSERLLRRCMDACTISRWQWDFHREQRGKSDGVTKVSMWFTIPRCKLRRAEFWVSVKSSNCSWKDR